MPPIITKLSNGTLFNFKEHLITITTLKVRAGGENITGEIDIESTRPATTPTVFYGRVNFLSLSGRQDLARHLKAINGDIPWHELLENVIRHTIKTTRREGGQIDEVKSTDEVPDVQFHVFPFIQQDQPTTLFGDGASGKSYIALLLASVVRIGWEENGLGLRLPEDEKPKEVVWLDYETSKDDFTRRLKRINEGMGFGYVNMFYRHCSHSIIEEIDELAPMVNSREPALIVIDSIGAACAGDLHGSEAPTLFFNAIRRLSGSKLLLFHSNKEKELYGNRFFWNFSRHVWEVKKQQVPGEDILSVGLFHRKANETKLYEPRAFNFIFEDGVTKVERADITDIPAMATNLTIKQRIQGLLKTGALHISEIAYELDEKENSINATLTRNKGLFIKLQNGSWGLLDNAT